MCAATYERYFTRPRAAAAAVPPPPPPRSCRRVGDAVGVEDIARVAPGVYLATSDDRMALWEIDAQPVDAVPDGALYAIAVAEGAADAGDPVLTRLELRNFPRGVAFHPHGLFYDAAAREAYVINHAYARGGERVDVFGVEARGRGLAVTYRRSVAPPSIADQHSMLNDLVVTGPDELYATQFLVVPMLPTGKAGFWGKLRHLKGFAIVGTNRRAAAIWRCTGIGPKMATVRTQSFMNGCGKDRRRRRGVLQEPARTSQNLPVPPPFKDETCRPSPRARTIVATDAEHCHKRLAAARQRASRTRGTSQASRHERQITLGTPQCAPVAGSVKRAHFYDGIAASPDGSRILAGDPLQTLNPPPPPFPAPFPAPPQSAVLVFDRDAATGALQYAETVPLAVAPDNISTDHTSKTEAYMIGSIHAMDYLKVTLKAPHVAKTADLAGASGRGGATRLVRRADGSYASELLHFTNQLPGVSCAVPVGTARVMSGSWYSNGVLICKV
ncbi:hypothetical protein JKP88DRAFT_303278 [Tribonema minus]|uniref:Uncharacterized protein n=1 Tax=Tribonema minus TaxID=303371 RepID=A0A835Z741_9STRA|nr:hypothetical protein JKP88DRAFT_303278 [Tribonema minus]